MCIYLNLCETCQFIKRSANGTERYCTKVDKFDTHRKTCTHLGGRPRRDVVIKLSEKIMFKNMKIYGYMLEKELFKYITAARIKTLVKHDFIKMNDEKYILGARGTKFIEKKGKKKKPR